jgi:hypothetical protein
MYCASGRVLSKNLVLSCAALYPYFSVINHFYIEKNPEMSGFWYVAKERCFFTFFKEDYYV